VRTTSGDRHFGPAASVDARALVLRWYDHWLKGVDTGMLEEPPVRLYVLGEDVWRDELEWPLARARYTRYYLRSEGRANTRAGDGALSADAPGAEPADSYVYDPADPTPSVAGRVSRPDGPSDQGPIEDREDVLVFSTPPLEHDVEVTGPIVAHLWASSSARDADWVVKVCDVYPDGYVFRLSDGMIRARYRHSQAQPLPLEPGRVENYVIELLPTSNLFRRGHRIRVEVASANFPAFDRNLNTGNALGTDEAGVPAVQLLYHDAERPSHVVLPIIPR
jgi:putative CocE/NonD family hydrolase